MSQMPSGGSVVQVKPQPNIYTALLIVAILALGVAIGLVLYNLMAPVDTGAGYGMKFGDLFATLQELVKSGA